MSPADAARIATVLAAEGAAALDVGVLSFVVRTVAPADLALLADDPGRVMGHLSGWQLVHFGGASFRLERLP
jgi:hypothetical protein